MLDETGYEATLLGQFQGKRMLGNVHMLLEKARGVASQISLSEFVSQIGEHIVDESRHEQASVSGEDENVVRLMTIHKAKGLEFPVVFVPELNTARQSFKEQLFNLYRDFPYLDEDMRSRSLQDLSMFFIIITSRELVRQEFIKNCED